MLNSGNKIRALREKKNYYSRVVRKILNETKNHNHTPLPLQVKWSVPNKTAAHI
jgi:hypothetical protein